MIGQKFIYKFGEMDTREKGGPGGLQGFGLSNQTCIVKSLADGRGLGYNWAVGPWALVEFGDNKSPDFLGSYYVSARCLFPLNNKNYIAYNPINKVEGMK